MDEQSSIYSEKKLAYYETTYKENILAKPQDVNVSITAAHLFGLAFICDQVGTKEEDPTYTRFSCSYDEITKIYINNNNRNSPIYIQCDEATKGVVNRRRIILPCFPNNDEIVNIISGAKAEFDKKTEKQRQQEKDAKLKEIEENKIKEHERLKKAADAEFESMTAGYEKVTKPSKPAEDFSVADILGLDDIVGTPMEEEAPVAAAMEETPEPKAEPAEETVEEVKPSFEEIAEPVGEKAEEPVEEAVPEAPAEEKAEEKKEDMFAQNMYVAEVKKEEVKMPEPVVEAKAEVPAPKAAKEDILSLGNKESMSLDEFQTAVKKLKSMLDGGVISDAEFAEEKKKLMKFLY